MNLTLRKARPYWGELRTSDLLAPEILGHGLFDDFFSNLGLSTKTEQSWPAMDIREEQDRYLIEAEVPGLTEKDLRVELEKGVLSVSGERKLENDEGEELKKQRKFHKREIFYGKFQKTFYLGNEVEVKDLKASLKNGILEIVVPKSQKQVAKVIPITVE